MLTQLYSVAPGQRAEALEGLAKIKAQPDAGATQPYQMALIHTELDDKDAAFSGSTELSANIRVHIGDRQRNKEAARSPSEISARFHDDMGPPKSVDVDGAVRARRNDRRACVIAPPSLHDVNCLRIPLPVCCCAAEIVRCAPAVHRNVCGDVKADPSTVMGNPGGEVVTVMEFAAT